MSLCPCWSTHHIPAPAAGSLPGWDGPCDFWESLRTLPTFSLPLFRGFGAANPWGMLQPVLAGRGALSCRQDCPDPVSMRDLELLFTALFHRVRPFPASLPLPASFCSSAPAGNEISGFAQVLGWAGIPPAPSQGQGITLELSPTNYSAFFVLVWFVLRGFFG